MRGKVCVGRGWCVGEEAGFCSAGAEGAGCVDTNVKAYGRLVCLCWRGWGQGLSRGCGVWGPEFF